jgi:hypothetical protein
MKPESFPAVVDFQSANMRPEYQGGLLSCTTFGATSALEAMADRAGFPQQLSPRFLWFYSDKSRLSVESVVATINRVGICRDELCPYVASTTPPYTVKDSEELPDLAALLDAQATKIKITVERIAGKDEVMRALATGHSLISVRVNPSGSEHVEAIIGYDDKGVKVHGSGYSIYHEPWESLGLVITQLWKITSCPWAPVPHPDYYEGDQPVFDGTTLTIPQIDLIGPDFKSSRFNSVKVTFDNFGRIDTNSGSIAWRNVPTFNIRSDVLALPVLTYQGQRYTRISLTNPMLKVVGYETPAAP